MTEKQREEIMRVLEQRSAYHKSHPEEARAFLLQTGIYTADGKLAPGYTDEEGAAAKSE